MKTLICLFLVLTSSDCVFAQPEITGAPWSVTLKLVDDNGQPIDGAHASVGYHITPPPGKVVDGYRESSAKIEGLTDSNGVFSASHSDASWSLGFDVRKPRYYSTHVNYDLFLPGQFDSATVTENRNPTLTLVLKMIGDPIPMYARIVESGPPVSDKPIGYDLMAGDWVSPYGKGQSTDFIFTRHFSGKAPFDYEFKLTVSFPNPGDGIQKFIPHDQGSRGSLLKSPHQAPASGYAPQLIKEERAHPGEQRPEQESNPNVIYFFRVRTILDETGGVKSALYGKIYGDFMQFRYYLNPVPNLRNIEFDPKQNLFKSSKSSGQMLPP